MNIQAQIKAIQHRIDSGKVKNIYAAMNKIKQLRMQLQNQNWNKYLSK